MAQAIRRGEYVLLLFPPLFWAGNLLIGRAFADELPPWGLVFWRWVIASACVLPFTWRELVAKRQELFRHWYVIVACAASGFAGYPVLNYIALHTTPAATAAMLNSTLPLMVPLLAWLVAREKPSVRTLAGIVVSFAGVAWIVCQGRWSNLTTLEIQPGDLLVLLAVAGYALYSVLLRYRPKGLTNLGFLAAMTTTTAALLFPAWIWEQAGGRTIPLQPYAIASVLFIGVFASLVANALWNRCVAAFGATLTGASFHLMAVYSSVLAFVLLAEPVRPFHLVGMFLILLGFGLTLTTRGRQWRSSVAPRSATTNT